MSKVFKERTNKQEALLWRMTLRLHGQRCGWGTWGQRLSLTMVLHGASHRSIGKTLQATYWGANGTHWSLCTTRSSAGSCPPATAIGARRKEPWKKAPSSHSSPPAPSTDKPYVASAGEGEKITGSSSSMKRKQRRMKMQQMHW